MNFPGNIARAKIARYQHDPKVVHTGPSSRGTSDSLARGLGWFSLGLGLAEIFMPARIARALGMEGNESLIRAYGLREIGAGMLTLSVEKQVGLWSRLAGDGLDIATLVPHLNEDNPKRDNVATALAMVIGVTLLDAVATQSTTSRHRRPATPPRMYYDRSGLPKGIAASRGLAARERTAGGTPGSSRPGAVEAKARGPALAPI